MVFGVAHSWHRALEPQENEVPSMAGQCETHPGRTRAGSSWLGQAAGSPLSSGDVNPEERVWATGMKGLNLGL